MRFPDSFGWVYSRVTELAGFRPNRDEHKLQWLSKDGQPEFLDKFRKLFSWKPNGSPALNRRFFVFGPDRLAFAFLGNSVRVHLVEREVNPLFSRLLHKFGASAAAPIPVNTSFNLFGEPLVTSPRGAVRSFYCAGVDALAIGPPPGQITPGMIALGVCIGKNLTAENCAEVVPPIEGVSSRK